MRPVELRGTPSAIVGGLAFTAASSLWLLLDLSVMAPDLGLDQPSVRGALVVIAVALLLLAGCMAVLSKQQAFTRVGIRWGARALFLILGAATTVDLVLPAVDSRSYGGGSSIPLWIPGAIPAAVATALGIAIAWNPTAGRSLRFIALSFSLSKVAEVLIVYGLEFATEATIARFLPVVGLVSTLADACGVVMGLALLWPWIRPGATRVRYAIRRLQRAHRDTTP